MEDYKKTIEGYQRQQIRLRGQINALKARKMGTGGQKIGTDTAATLRRTERQIADLDRAIARYREKTTGSRLRR
jgi:hypothetical protein